MQPRTARQLTSNELVRLKEKVQSTVRTASAIDQCSYYASQFPEEIGLQLTNGCNLRCSHCFQWGETGFHNGMTPQAAGEEIPLEIVKKVLNETRLAKSKLFLWGGEPLVYTAWEGLVHLLEDDPRWTVLCTNGINLMRRMESILRISDSLVCLLSIDGLQKANDAIRGEGSFARIMQGVYKLLDLKKSKLYKGEVSVSCVISNANCQYLYEFLEELELDGLNTVYLVFPWYITQQAAHEMDRYYNDKFVWLEEQCREMLGDRSWHAYKYHLDPNNINLLKESIKKIKARTWKIRVRYQPALELDEVEEFIRGSTRPAMSRTRCLSVATRMSVLPNGGVTTCKLFPEFTVGNLSDQSVTELWHGYNARKARATFACGLTPVCSKCVQLYLHGK
jgi:sulfatase maturation enzyme AslB (radical SAM superfamily)